MMHRFFATLLICSLSATSLSAQAPVPEARPWDDIKRPAAAHPYGSMDAAQIDTEIDRVLQEFCDTLEAEERRINETLGEKDARHPLLLQVRAA